MTESAINNPQSAIYADYRSGFVAVVGRPNVGKSTLINALLGQKITIVSPKPQTTRNRLLGILTRADAQVIFIDTPGIHQPLHRLGKVMVETATAALPDADVVLWLVDAADLPTDEDRQVAAALTRLPAATPLLLGLNKCDRLALNRKESTIDAYLTLAPRAEVLLFSATRGDNLDVLLSRLIAALPLGPQLYPEDEITDQQERFIAAELVREQALLNLRDEVPHALAVLVNDFKDRSEQLTYISAVIYVERETQKGILLGKDGQMLKRIGQGARREIEDLLGRQVFLDLWVKVRPKWRTNEEELRRLGYQTPKVKPAKGGRQQKFQ
jgi:GTP-binding protein Era